MMGLVEETGGERDVEEDEERGDESQGCGYD